MEIQEEYYSINEICRNFKISQSTVYKMIKNIKIRAIKFGRCWKIPKTELLQRLYEKFLLHFSKYVSAVIPLSA